MSFSSDDDDESMRERIARAAHSQGQGAWGKQPLRNDVADRIKNQTHENLQRRLRDRIQELEGKLLDEQTHRRNEANNHELELDSSLELIDKLLDFIAQNFGGDLPHALHEMIADRQEQRLLANPGPFEDSTMSPSEFAAQSGGHRLANVATPIPSGDGAVLRMGPDGKVGYSAPFTGSESPMHSASEAMRRLLNYLE